MAKRTEETRHQSVLREARTRFKRCQNWESTARSRYINDIKFCEGDSDNLYQWPEEIRNRLEGDSRAILTINKTKQHCLDILNDARQSKVAIKIRPTGDGASFDSAQLFMGVTRHIEYISNAGMAYQHALSAAVRGGWGYWRVVTEYANDDSFDQEIFIRRVKDTLSVYLDPDINEFDGSDARFGFVFTEMPRDEYDLEYPDKQNVGGDTLLGGETWVREKTVRKAEYFRRVEVKDRLLAYVDPDDEEGKVMKVVRASALPDDMVKALLKLRTTQVRPIKTHKVEWFKIVGNEIVDERPWPGIYIPIVRCVGEETVIDGKLDRKGHTRALKDPQRMFNYNASGSVEFGALQSKTPYVGPADAIEGYEDQWNNANIDNAAYLPFNHMDDEGTPIPAPQRQEPPRGAPVFMQGMQDAAEWMRMVSGQYQADMGAPSNERSGVAITARQRQGDNATFHFLDHQSIAIRFTGKILIDLIPKVYDTERVLKIMGDDGNETQVKIDPNADKAYQKVEEDRAEIAAIFNPKVGKYEVEADVGPAFATARQEAWTAYTQIISENKDLMMIIGDLAFKAADFPGAEEIAKRLKRMVPQQALEDGPSPDLMAAKQQIEALTSLVKQVTAKLADKTAAHINDQEKLAVSAYDSQTKRLAALKDHLLVDPENLVQLVKQVMIEAESTSAEGLSPALTQDAPITAQDVMPQQPPPGAPPGAPGGPGPADTGGGVMPNESPNDMTTGPAPSPGGAPSGPAI
jgi:hypothetical protein